MPISRPDAIPIVGEIIWGKSPQSILDIGVGFGMWGVLFRAWTDIRLSEVYPRRYGRHGWQTRIHGIEIHEGYRNVLHTGIYDVIWYGDALQLLQAMQPGRLYDHIHLGDVIEHLDKSDGVTLLKMCRDHLTPGGGITVVTPNGFRPQGAVLGNVHETHKCGWTEREFYEVGMRLCKGGMVNTWTTKAHNQLLAAFQS